MALNKAPLSINFAQGVSTKVDPKQIPPGRFLMLRNSVFGTDGMLKKRFGYSALPVLPGDASYITTVNDNLTAVGSTISALSEGSASWVQKGTIQPLELSTMSLIRNSVNQSQCDTALATNGLICTVYTEVNSGTSVYKYAIADSTTGQNIVAPTPIPVASGAVSGSPRVFLLGNYFVLVFTNTITAVNHLQYIAISTSTPTMATANTDIASVYTPASTVAWDGVVYANNLYIAYNTTSGGQSVKVTSLSSYQAGAAAAPATAKTFAAEIGQIFSATVDSTMTASPVIYFSYVNSGTRNLNILAVDQNLNTVMSPTNVVSSGIISNIAMTATAGVCSVFYEVESNYSYTAVASHYIASRAVTKPATVTTGAVSPAAGSAATGTVRIRSVGLASKALIVDGVTYFIGLYSSTYQPTYFLIRGDSTAASPKVIAKLAYQNGGAYYILGLPSISIEADTTIRVPYLIKDLIASVSKETDVAAGTQTAGVYSQTGINLARFTIGTEDISSVEIAKSLHITGGFLWMYDGYLPVEHSFFVYPDNVVPVGSSGVGSLIAQQYFYQAIYEWTDNQGNIHRSAPSIPTSLTIVTAPGSFTGDRTSTSFLLQNVSSMTGLQVGQAISGTGIPANTYIVSIDSATQLTMSQAATSGTATSTTVTPVTLSSVTVNVPTLRLTYKTANPVKIVIYRWSTAQQSYYQVTSVTSATLNSTTTDSVAFVDSLSDAAILGNSLIYTTGGVVENTAAPATKALTLFDNRLWYIDAENPNVLGYSKQVIQDTPVETSDLLTLYIAPTIGAQASTGPSEVLSAMDDKLIIFKGNAIYYINGSGPDNTGANSQYSQPIYITGTVGCVNPRSVVLMQNGLMFQSDKGIWLLGRDLSTSYIGADVEGFNDGTVQSAVVVPETTQVRFTMSTGVTLVYDYYYNQWGTFTNVPAISSCIYEGLHTYLNQYGQIMQETPGRYLDGSNPVLMSFTTSWFNLAGLQGYERFYSAYLLGTYYTPFTLDVQIGYDYNSSATQSIQVLPDNYNAAWGGEANWGSGGPWGGPGNVFEARLFPQIQKCEAFQITVNEVYDATYGVAAGQGLSLSGLDLLVGVKKGTRVQKAGKSFG